MAGKKKPPGFPPPSGGGGGGGGSVPSGGSSSSSSSASSGGGMSAAVAKAYRHIAANYGWSLSSAQVAKLFKESVSVSELQQRFAALQRVKENGAYFNQFEAVLQNQGLLKGNLTLKDALSFVAGAAPGRWYDIWSRAANRAVLATAGLQVGGIKAKTNIDLAVTAKQAELIRSKLGQDAVISGAGAKQAQTLAAAFLHDLPEARFQEFGLSKKDFITAVYGGAGSTAVQAQIGQLEVNAAARGNEATLAQPQRQPTGYTAGTQ